ncbi:uncharacterized protein LOC143183378 [Calliopsis andreniformis]|uniref:uncharacterized protein LOC143183378 n=1 Tax=Calliopsis andreniformis TaxID=337506 RepID=UPI003FCE5AE3
MHTLTHTLSLSLFPPLSPSVRARMHDREEAGARERTLFALHRAIQPLYLFPSTASSPPPFLARLACLLLATLAARSTRANRVRYGTLETPLLRLTVIPPRKRAHFVPVPARTAAASRLPTTYPCGRRRHLYSARRTPRDWMAPPTRRPTAARWYREWTPGGRERAETAGHDRRR